ncbi:hypothetical protein CsSME_00029692 [Camellia sinensis var. sinensis]
MHSFFHRRSSPKTSQPVSLYRCSSILPFRRYGGLEIWGSSLGLGVNSRLTIVASVTPKRTLHHLVFGLLVKATSLCTFLASSTDVDSSTSLDLVCPTCLHPIQTAGQCWTKDG